MKYLSFFTKIRAGAAAGQPDREDMRPSEQAAPSQSLRESASRHQGRQAQSRVCLHPEGWDTENSASPKCFRSDSDIWGRDGGGATAGRCQGEDMFICFPRCIWCLMNSDTCNTVLGICFWIWNLYTCLKRFQFPPQGTTWEIHKQEQTRIQVNSSIYFQTTMAEFRKGSPAHWLQCDEFQKATWEIREKKTLCILPGHVILIDLMSFEHKDHTLRDDA